MFIVHFVYNEYYILYKYALYKNAGFWLVNSRDISLQIQALHCEFAEYLLHVGVFAKSYLPFLPFT
jgi:hypothetical protein